MGAQEIQVPVKGGEDLEHLSSVLGIDLRQPFLGAYPLDVVEGCRLEYWSPSPEKRERRKGTGSEKRREEKARQ